MLSGVQLGGQSQATAIFTGAEIRGAQFGGLGYFIFNGPPSYSTIFLSAQLYSTASYANHDLSGVGLSGLDLTGWNFANQNLTGAHFDAANLTNANFTGAIVKGATFGGRYHTPVGVPEDITAPQLSSTASYAAGDLTGIGLTSDDLSGWSFANENLSGRGT